MRKNYFSKLMASAVALLSLSFGLISCEDILGEWDRPTPATPEAPTILTPAVGRFLNKDGSITATKQASGDNESYAVIAYVGAIENYCSEYIAIALEDVDANASNWGTALTNVDTYAAAHPITIDGTTYNTNTMGTECYDKVRSDETTSSATATAVQKGWRLPSVTDLRYIFAGIGLTDPTPISPVGVSDGMTYDTGSSLLDKINTACGNTNLQSSKYWSGSQFNDGTPDPGKAWYYDFTNSKFNQQKKNNTTPCARAIFAY